MKNTKPVIGITMGDYNGIGPEIALKAAISARVRKKCIPILIGSTDVFSLYAEKMKLPVTLREIIAPVSANTANVVNVFNPFPFIVPLVKTGTIHKQAGKFAGDCISVAVQLCLENQIDAIVTAPLSKESMKMGGYNFPGQTELLAHLTRSMNVMMILMAENFRVGLTTVHVPIKNVAGLITKKLIAEKINSLVISMQKDFGISKPKIAVLGLNPHAGEKGLIGKEEQLMIAPVIRAMQKKGLSIDGAFPADGFFGKHDYKNYNAVLAMYHDQGLIPLKMMGFEIGVNFTAGLPIIRTSPDHGTAFDIAGKGIANPSSMIEAMLSAILISKNRKLNKK